MSARERAMRNAKHSSPIIFSVLAAMFVALAAVAGATDLKFHAAPGPEPVVGRYLVTLDSSVTPELAAGTASSLARTYGGQLEPYQSSDARQFAIAMLPARARGLSADQRVRDVAEIAHRDDDALAPPPSPQTATSSRHLIPVAADSTLSGTYLYDGSGNIKAIGNDTFIYDAEGRLKQAIVEGSQESYDYDPFGNRKSSVRASGAAGCIGGCDLPVTPKQESNHVEQASYDEAGNVWSMNGATYSYDGTGMVTGAIVGSDHRDFLYTADDERIAVRQGTSWTWTVRDLGGKVLREFTSFETSASPLTLTTHTWSKDYVWRDGLLLASVIPAGSGTMTYHYHVNHLGTPRLVTDQNHILIGKHTYYPFGAEMDLMPRENPIELMKFTGHERDIVASDNNSLDYMHARFYNGNLGRFLSIDPIGGDAFLPQSWNRYSYVANNPLNRTDPSGQCGEPANFIGPPAPCQTFTMQIDVTAKSPPPLATHASDGWLTIPHPFYLEQAWKERYQPPKSAHKSTFTPAQCRELGLVAEREQKLGTGRAALKSSNTFGDRAIGAFNVDFNNRGNPTVSSGEKLDVDWFTDIMIFGDDGRRLAPITYTLGKSFWHAAGGTKGYPFVSDPGEVTAVNYAVSGETFLSIYRDNCQ